MVSTIYAKLFQIPRGSKSGFPSIRKNFIGYCHFTTKKSKMGCFFSTSRELTIFYLIDPPQIEDTVQTPADVVRGISL
ncbi:hypothetical protein PRUPE_2G129900 [Prunus persica]|uniref:Uncharacterized protein n=1 Tax=Prunus persica TaxID=3760 RepID=A0A251QF72_PRUPE|nr:hypothetical protein PRUPE_2G129900 [Prunus persica]